MPCNSALHHAVLSCFLSASIFCAVCSIVSLHRCKVDTATARCMGPANGCRFTCPAVSALHITHCRGWVCASPLLLYLPAFHVPTQTILMSFSAVCPLPPPPSFPPVPPRHSPPHALYCMSFAYLLHLQHIVPCSVLLCAVVRGAVLPSGAFFDLYIGDPPVCAEAKRKIGEAVARMVAAC